MDVGWQLKLIFLFLLILGSAFFSGSEVAFFSLNRNKLDLSNSRKLADRYLMNLLDAPKRLLVTILIGNTIINVGASILAVSIAIDLIQSTNASPGLILVLQIIIVTVLVILFGELLPKIFATKKPLSYSRAAAIPLYWINVLLFPVAETLNEFIRAASAKIKISKASSVIRHDELSELARISHERGTIIEEEQGLINSLVNFRQVAVHEIMTPRVDITAVSEDTSYSELLEVITESGFRRIPLFKDDLDKVTGIIYAKDVLPLLKEPEKLRNISLSEIAREPMFVPTSKLISSLMLEFQEKKMHLAIVVDEYGGTAGLISLEDIIEEIIGEIRDEYDKEENTVTKLSDDAYLVLGKLSIYELNELVDSMVLSEDTEFETVGGLILNHAGDIPREGYSFRLNNVKFTVKEIVNKRIKKVLVEKIPGE